MTFLAWNVWCELIGLWLYDLMLALPADLSADMNAGFDEEHYRLFPAFYLQ